MTIKSWSKGRPIFFDQKSGNWHYGSGGIVSNESNVSCVKCGLSGSNGEDSCLGNLGWLVVAACCGHGVAEGYIMFRNGYTMRINQDVKL